MIDFGEAFFKDSVPDTLHTPLAVRAPEIIFGDTFDRRVDMWSAGCLVSHLTDISQGVTELTGTALRTRHRSAPVRCHFDDTSAAGSTNDGVRE